MKRSTIALIFALYCIPAFAVSTPGLHGDTSAPYVASGYEISQEPQQQKQMTRRQARQAKYERELDSMILSGYYRFKPIDYRGGETGVTSSVRNADCEVRIMDSYCDIFMPYFAGDVARERISMLRALRNSIEDYTAVKTDDGNWNISFGTRLFASDDYEFTIIVTPKTKRAKLIMHPVYGNTVTYNGYIMSAE